jgi:hypothetical protein
VDGREAEGIGVELLMVRWLGQRSVARCGAALCTWLGQEVKGSEEEGQRTSGGRILC